MDLFVEDKKEEFYNINDHKEHFNEYDLLAIEYKTANRRRRNEIVLIFVNRFENLVKKRIGSYIAKSRVTNKSLYYKEGMAYWRLLVCQRLHKWDGSQSTKYDFVNFLAYLLPCADKQVVSELHEKIAYKDLKYASSTTIEGMDISDAFNNSIDNSDSFKAYESALMLHAFPFKAEDIEGMAREATINNFTKEMGGLYNAYNSNQWDAMYGTHKHFGLSQDGIIKTGLHGYKEVR